ncbi:hypothetical protein [Kocuria palustris]|uniref:hypothetical protein n=1 Tax=Kocuria palustris TaxID=71999 RepID=UPI0024685A6D|nr:hypothetical protein [Kocuria palustris]MDH5150729.1 hypothetical protein [Kocuria palustris]
MTAQSDFQAAVDRVGTARGAEEDQDWALTAGGRLLMEEVLERRIVEALDEVAEQVAAAQEPAQELFGDPLTWARGQEAAWREQGVALKAPPTTSPRDFAVETLIIASFYAGLFLLYELITWSWADPLKLSFLLAPLALALTSRTIAAVHTAVTAARSHTAGVLAAVAAALPGIALSVGVFALGNPVTLPGTAMLGFLGAVVAYALLAWATALAWPARPARTAAPHDGASWYDALGAALRSRGNLTDSRVKEILAEARSHAQEAGTSPAEEFGAAEAYAQRFAPNRAVAARRRAWLMTGVAGLALLTGVLSLVNGQLRPWAVLWLLLVVVIAALEWRRARKLS